MKRENLPFRVATELITEDGDPVDWPTTMKMLLQFFCSSTIVNLDITAISITTQITKHTGYKMYRKNMTDAK